MLRKRSSMLWLIIQSVLIYGEASLLDAVKRCWASLWTARAISYRARHGIAPQDVSLAVVVQELVDADAAGILFTANPLTGARDQVLINATWGLGEAIVGGQVRPDLVMVDRASRLITEQQINAKEVMTVRALDGTHEQPVPAIAARTSSSCRSRTRPKIPLGSTSSWWGYRRRRSMSPRCSLARKTYRRRRGSVFSSVTRARSPPSAAGSTRPARHSAIAS